MKPMTKAATQGVEDQKLSTESIREIIGGLTQARLQVKAVQALVYVDRQEHDGGPAINAKRDTQITVLKEVYELLGKIRSQYTCRVPEKKR